ncbi:bifunctional diguanylate cyclase/phosphodiesterase [Cohnella sp. REN36]|uniref:bifunctional diguanylate cyclase/phosphodiesterase n=1 Tax=Cohnella sp. REN36 TaxID=2887347 RepID=UPI001D144024|nr:bifunctional diguanylate cyclase/phosphodiesterase [Cohnella sp. REN36]MCC3372569.1 EAL domain-containing protein [Cohnella sp. REN36]
MPVSVLSSDYDIPLVLLSFLIAILASYAALDFGIRIFKTEGAARYAWLSGGAFAMGMGIWAMHFIAMLAFHLNSMQVSYDPTIVLLSIAPAILASGLALHIVTRPGASTARFLVGALFIGAGIVSMHYVGMAAMVMEAAIVYDPFLWALSAAIALVTSYVALLLLRDTQRRAGARGGRRRKAGSAFIMAIAISGMHYTGMSAATFKHDHHAMGSDASAIDSSLLAYSIGIGMFVLLVLALIGAFVKDRFESQTAESERKFRSVIESANDAIVIADSAGILISWNRSAERTFGYTEQDALGRQLDLIIPERYRETQRQGMERYLVTGEARAIGRTIELHGLRKDGTEFPLELSMATWEQDGRTFFSMIIRDITERKKAEEKMNRMVYRDPLTGLPNRHLLNDRLAQALDQAGENKMTIAIMFIDLDRFKYINDTLGHAMGDLLLIEAAARIQSCTGKGDTVSRQGGDEFLVLLPNAVNDEVTRKAKQLLQMFAQPFVLNDTEMFVTPSIGISLYPSDGRDIETLIKNADTAMYRVKEQGKNNFQFYTPDMNEAVTKKMKLEIGLRKGLDRREFTVHYQPQLEVGTGRIKGVEALLRWRHPELGNVSPAEFIPLAEETGLIIPIGEWVLYEACRQAKAWQDEGLPPLRMAVNISSRQFQQSNLLGTVSRILQETGLAPQYLELELTESIIQDSKYAIATMGKLKEMGIFLSIDDFGTGYSSLSYLKLFPIDTLKIDQSFTRNILADAKDAALVQTIINMAHNLELKVIAEGVETQEQLHFLTLRNCNEAQGYYFSRPVAADELSALLREASAAQAAAAASLGQG